MKCNFAKLLTLLVIIGAVKSAVPMNRKDLIEMAETAITKAGLSGAQEADLSDKQLALITYPGNEKEPRVFVYSSTV